MENRWIVELLIFIWMESYLYHGEMVDDWSNKTEDITKYCAGFVDNELTCVSFISLP